MRAIAVQVNPFENIKYDKPLLSIHALKEYWPNTPSVHFLYQNSEWSRPISFDVVIGSTQATHSQYALPLPGRVYIIVYRVDI